MNFYMKVLYFERAAFDPARHHIQQAEVNKCIYIPLKKAVIVRSTVGLTFYTTTYSVNENPKIIEQMENMARFRINGKYELAGGKITFREIKEVEMNNEELDKVIEEGRRLEESKKKFRGGLEKLFAEAEALSSQG